VLTHQGSQILSATGLHLSISLAASADSLEGLEHDIETLVSAFVAGLNIAADKNQTRLD
jgi:hypothetical protein